MRLLGYAIFVTILRDIRNADFVTTYTRDFILVNIYNFPQELVEEKLAKIFFLNTEINKIYQMKTFQGY